MKSQQKLNYFNLLLIRRITDSSIPTEIEWAMKNSLHRNKSKIEHKMLTLETSTKSPTANNFSRELIVAYSTLKASNDISINNSLIPNALLSNESVTKIYFVGWLSSRATRWIMHELQLMRVCWLSLRLISQLQHSHWHFFFCTHFSCMPFEYGVIYLNNID